jgi:hypothetical protein
MEAKARNQRLIQANWPEFGPASYPPQAPATKFEKRINDLRAMMGERELTHLVVYVYGDREHFANLAYLTGFDSRFEEALLVISPDRNPLLVVGNECEAYLGVSPLFNNGKLRKKCFQPFSLLNQPRDQSRFIREIFAGEGIDESSIVGCVGWKYFSDREPPDAQNPIDIPSYLADTLRALAGESRVVNATDLLIHPGYGLRSFCSPSEIAYFEYTSVQASESMKRMIFGMREGMTDHEVVALAGINAEPLGCHSTFTTGRTAKLGLSSPKGARRRQSGRRVKRRPSHRAQVAIRSCDEIPDKLWRRVDRDSDRTWRAYRAGWSAPSNRLVMLFGRSVFGEGDLDRGVFAEEGKNLTPRHSRTCNVVEFQVNEEGRYEAGWNGSTSICEYLLCARVGQF